MGIWDNLAAYWTPVGGVFKDLVAGRNMTLHNTVTMAAAAVPGGQAMVAASSGAGAGRMMSLADVAALNLGARAWSAMAWGLVPGGNPDGLTLLYKVTPGGCIELDFGTAIFATRTYGGFVGTSDNPLSATLYVNDSVLDPGFDAWLMAVATYDPGSTHLAIHVREGGSASDTSDVVNYTPGTSATPYCVGGQWDGVSAINPTDAWKQGPTALWIGRALTSGDVDTLWNGGAGLAFTPAAGGGGYRRLRVANHMGMGL